MKKAIEKLGLHLTVLLYKEGADDQAYEEIIDSLEKARERAKDAPQGSSEDRKSSNAPPTTSTTSMTLHVGGAT